MKKSGNTSLRKTVVMLEKAGKKSESAIWEKASDLLAAPTALRVEVNVGRISRIAASENDATKIFVPGKVLGWGTVEKKIVVGAFAFSDSARKKIESKGGSAMSAEEFVKKFQSGSGVTLVK